MENHLLYSCVWYRHYSTVHTRPTVATVAKMVVFDVVVHLPMMYFLAYYTIKELVAGDMSNPVDRVQNGLGKYRVNMKEDLTAMIKLWGASD